MIVKEEIFFKLIIKFKEKSMPSLKLAARSCAYLWIYAHLLDESGSTSSPFWISLQSSYIGLITTLKTHRVEKSNNNNNDNDDDDNDNDKNNNYYNNNNNQYIIIMLSTGARIFKVSCLGMWHSH